MMSRDVKIIRTDRYYWIISIDDKIVQLSRYRYRIDLGVVENVENILKIIEDVFMWRRTFLDVRGLINGTNLFVLLDAIYPESTIELFDNLYLTSQESPQLSCSHPEHPLQPVSAEFMTLIPFSTFFIRKALNCLA